MRSVHVYPEAHLVGNEWLFLVKLTDRDTGEDLQSPHTETAGVTSPLSLTLLKVSFTGFSPVTWSTGSTITCRPCGVVPTIVSYAPISTTAEPI